MVSVVIDTTTSPLIMELAGRSFMIPVTLTGQAF